MHIPLLPQIILDKLVRLLEMNTEYIEVFGVPVDTNFRNAVVGLLLSAVATVASALIAIVVQRFN